MNFNKHLNLKDKHAFLAASQYSWLNYDVEKLHQRYDTVKAAALGTELHEFAAKAIKLGIKMPNNRQTINMYVNDALGYHMDPEVTLYVSDNAFGTADAISFNRNLLRIHDLKTGKGKVSMAQLHIYAAYFCIEYDVDPYKIKMELRIYQNKDIIVDEPDPRDIRAIMDKVLIFDKELDKIKAGKIVL